MTFLVWRLRTGACGVGPCGFWRYRMPPESSTITLRVGFSSRHEMAICPRMESSSKWVGALSTNSMYWLIVGLIDWVNVSASQIYSFCLYTLAPIPEAWTSAALLSTQRRRYICWRHSHYLPPFGATSLLFIFVELYDWFAPPILREEAFISTTGPPSF